MMLDTFEQQSFDAPKFDISDKISSLHKSFKNKLASVNGVFLNPETSKIDTNAANWLGLEDSGKLAPYRSNIFEDVKRMYAGVPSEIEGRTTMGLKSISEMKINPDNYYSNLKQHAGNAAEVIGTAKENLLAKINGTGTLTYRVDDLTEQLRNQFKERYDDDFLRKNDQYVDKVRVLADGSRERIQTKFVGKNAEECFKKLMNPSFDKYYFEGKVDKIEVPADYFDIIKTKCIPEKISNLTSQYDNVKKVGKLDVAEVKQHMIERANKLNEMIEKSPVTSEESMYSAKHPIKYSTKIFTKAVSSTRFVQETIPFAHGAGLDSGLETAALTAAVSTVDNVTKVMSGEISAQEAFADVAKDTGTAGAIGYGTAFVGTAIAEGMENSSHVLIQSMGKAGIPATVISFGVESYDTVSDYAQGKIDTDDLVYELGENVASVAGGTIGGVAGGALAGAVVGSAVPGVGTVVGFAAGMAGGMVGSAVAAEAYKTAVAVGSDAAGVLADKAETLAKSTVEIAEKNIPDMADKVIGAFNDFAKTNSLPFQI